LRVHILAELPKLAVYLAQPLVEVLHFLLLNPFNGVKLGEVVGLEPAQARQLPISLLRLGSCGLGRLLGLSALCAGDPEILL
jgi:hypothetical protein